MQINIHFSGGKRSDFGNHDFERVLAGSLERFERRLKSAHLYITDVNGPKGGIDKHCRCVLHLRRMSPIVIQDQDASMNALLYRVANRASYALTQKVDRRNKRKRERVREYLMEPVSD
ncbi:hypothetical protein F1728_24470 [Gimesia benthica]|uniref:HPF/RaiA family ribosome-associated protein n=1 Tax=Gimesia benthica TaxID=2608982 RepID=A0A6I6AJA6_9PLAN|nr:hypothetical protein [Gimesia benthica]QGQ25642.1 hypothetical protein F1728_24470 [Gimesia benthica]